MFYPWTIFWNVIFFVLFSWTVFLKRKKKLEQTNCKFEHAGQPCALIEPAHELSFTTFSTDMGQLLLLLIGSRRHSLTAVLFALHTTRPLLPSPHMLYNLFLLCTVSFLYCWTFEQTWTLNWRNKPALVLPNTSWSLQMIVCYLSKDRPKSCTKCCVAASQGNEEFQYFLLLLYNKGEAVFLLLLCTAGRPYTNTKRKHSLRAVNLLGTHFSISWLVLCFWLPAPPSELQCIPVHYFVFIFPLFYIFGSV